MGHEKSKSQFILMNKFKIYCQCNPKTLAYWYIPFFKIIFQIMEKCFRYKRQNVIFKYFYFEKRYASLICCLKNEIRMHF